MNALYLLMIVIQIQTAPILMDLSCVHVIVNLKETKLFVKVKAEAQCAPSIDKHI